MMIRGVSKPSSFFVKTTIQQLIPETPDQPNSLTTQETRPGFNNWKPKKKKNREKIPQLHQLLETAASSIRKKIEED
jgi:hypothetical protein